MQENDFKRKPINQRQTISVLGRSLNSESKTLNNLLAKKTIETQAAVDLESSPVDDEMFVNRKDRDFNAKPYQVANTKPTDTNHSLPDVPLNKTMSHNPTLTNTKNANYKPQSDEKLGKSQSIPVDFTRIQTEPNQPTFIRQSPTINKINSEPVQVESLSEDKDSSVSPSQITKLGLRLQRQNSLYDSTNLSSPNSWNQFHLVNIKKKNSFVGSPCANRSTSTSVQSPAMEFLQNFNLQPTSFNLGISDPGKFLFYSFLSSDTYNLSR
jgi:hypothetical protein